MVNFFPSPGSYFEDVLRLEYVSDIPLDNKETTGRDDYFQPKKGDFDIVIEFPLYDGVTSDINSYTARQFFEQRNKRILAVIEYGNFKRAGFMARETMEFDYTTSEGNDNLRFTCIGILGEFIEYLKNLSLPDYVNTNTQQVTFNTFLVNGLFDANNQIRLTVNNQLNPVTKFGGEVYLSTPLYNDIRSRVTNLEDLNRWVFFKQIAYTLGIKYDLECDFVSPSSNGVVTFVLNLVWRTESSTTRDFTIKKFKKGFRLPEQKKWVMVRDREYIYTTNLGSSSLQYDLTACAGLLYNKDTTYQANPGSSDIQNMFIAKIKVSRSDTGELLEETSGKIWKFRIENGIYWFDVLVDNIEEINFISLEDEARFSVGTYAPLVSAGVMILARLFVKSFTHSRNLFVSTYVDNTDDILVKSTKAEYKFLVNEEEKETNTMVYDFPVGSEANLYDLFTYDGVNYSIERMRVDYINEELEADLIEV